MRKFPRSAISLLLIAVICSLTLAGTPSYPVETPAPCQSGNQKGKKIQVLKNDAAKLRVKQLAGKNKAFKRALKDMEKLGKSPDWEKSGVFTEVSNDESEGKIAPSRLGANSFAQQQQAFSDGAGSEMVMVTESGPEEYWSGIIYVHDATTGLDATYAAVLTGLVMTQLDTMDVIDELYYPPDGSSPIREEPPTSVDPGDGGGGRDPFLILEVAKNNLKSTPSVGMTNAAFSARAATSPRAGFLGWFKRYFRCVKRCQALTTLTCFNIFAMPRPGMPYPNYQGFFVCLSFGTLASSIVCAFNTHSCGG
jgi:hypothetical protein